DQETDDKRSPDGNEPGPRCDCHETNHKSCGSADQRWAAVFDHIDQHPGKQCGRSGDSRGHKCMGGEAVGSQGASGVKTEPSEPEHGGTENDKRYIVDPVGHVFISAAFSKKERKDK